MPKLTLKNFRNHDPADMYTAISQFPQQIDEAIRLAKDGPTIPTRGIRRVVILGMGGSAIGGDMLRSYITGFRNHNGVDIVVNRDYNPPGVGKGDLLVTSSYSGNTEETLSAFNAARKNATDVFVLTTGGKLGKSAKSNSYATINLPGGLQPRAALGYSFFPLLYTLAVKSNLFGDDVKRRTERGIKETRILLEKLNEEFSSGPLPGNRAYRYAEQINGTVPVIYSATERLDTINLRWRGQIQENAKYLAFGNLLPEMNHNEINGWSNPKSLVGKFTPIFLRDREDHRRNQRRLDITRRIIEASAGRSLEIESEGGSTLARMFSLVHLGDWISYYLAGMNGVDPSPVPVIESLKNELKG